MSDKKAIKKKKKKKIEAVFGVFDEGIRFIACPNNPEIDRIWGKAKVIK